VARAIVGPLIDDKWAAPESLTNCSHCVYMCGPFSQKTGIPTQFVEDSTGPLLAKIEAEKNNPQWTVLWIDGVEAMAGLDIEGMLLKGYEPNVAWTDQGKSVVPSTQAYIPTGLTVAGSLVYDTRTVTQPPATWQDLLKPEWKAQVGMNNPSISGPTYPFVAGMMSLVGGEDQGKSFFQQLEANGLKVYNKNSNTLHALDIGEIKLAIVQSTAGVGAIHTTPSIKVTFPSKVSLMPSSMGIDAKAPAQAQAEAKMLAEYLLSAEGQQIATTAAPTGDSLFWPIVAGAKAAVDLPAIASVHGQVVDPYAWGPKQSDIDQWFTDNIVQ
jgi:iron(III) transport system substrate-binding protein